MLTNLSKQKWSIRLFCLLSIFSLFTFFSLHVQAQDMEDLEEQVQSNPDDFEVDASAAIAIDAQTGKIFYKQNADEPLAIASMTKMITLYMVLDAIQAGTISWDTPVEISDNVMLISQDMNLSNVVLNQETVYTVKDLYEATSIFSANGAAIALAEMIAGSEAAFVDQMRLLLESWGIQDATIVSASGLNNADMIGETYPGSAPDAENFMSARSMAIVAQHLINDFPESLETAKTPSKVFMPNTTSQIEMINWNLMLPGASNYKEGVDGLKTGTTDLAGACFTGTMEKDGLRIITVVMDAKNHLNDNGARFQETAAMMDFVYANWHKETLYNQGDTLNDYFSLPVTKGKEDSVTIVLNEPVIQWVRNDWDTSLQQIDFQVDENKLVNGTSLEAPVQKGEEVGNATIHLLEDNLGYVDQTKADFYPMVTNGTVAKANIFVLMGRSIKEFFQNIF